MFVCVCVCVCVRVHARKKGSQATALDPTMAHGPNQVHSLFLETDFAGAQPHTFIYILSMATFVLQPDH